MDLNPNRELQDIISNGDLEKLKRLLENGLDPDTKIGADTLLTKAVRYDNIIMVKLLVENGASLTKNDYFGRNPRIIAKLLKMHDIEKYLRRKQSSNY